MPQSKITERLLRSQAQIVAQLERGRIAYVAALRFYAARKAVGPLGLVQQDARFRSHYCHYSSARSWADFLSRARRADELWKLNPWLATAAIHASDGYLRQKAVAELNEPENDPLDLAALLCRCNDPVPQVQRAAMKRWTEICQMPKVDALVDVLPILLDRTRHWQRGGADALVLVEQRPDYRRLLEDMFLKANGPVAKRLRFTLGTPALDDALGVLAVRAQSSFVRSVATQVVLEGQVRRQVGKTWQWVDKTIALRRRVPEWEVREVVVAPDLRDKVLRATLCDPSVGVRKLGVDFLTTVGPEGFEKELALLRLDQKGPIKWRMEFFDRKWSGENSESKNNDKRN